MFLKKTEKHQQRLFKRRSRQWDAARGRGKGRGYRWRRAGPWAAPLSEPSTPSVPSHRGRQTVDCIPGQQIMVLISFLRVLVFLMLMSVACFVYILFAVARPPSSFRLLPLPEEDGGRAVPVLPALPPARDPRRQQFRASSLSDVLEITEPYREPDRRTHSSPQPRPAEPQPDTQTHSQPASQPIAQSASKPAVQTPAQATAPEQPTQHPSVQPSHPLPTALIQKIHQEVSEPAVTRKTRGSSGELRKGVSLDSGAGERAAPPQETAYQDILMDLRNTSLPDVQTKLEKLYKFIVESNNPKLFQKKKSELIKILCGFVDTESPQVLILLVQILLSVQVRKQNLATAYKLVFKVARQDENDDCFMEGDALDLLINSIGCACPVSDSEALVYGYGALKFLTMNSKTREKLRRMGILDLVLLHLKLICEAKAERKIAEETSHVLFQLTGVLRNLVNDTSSQRLLVSMSGIAQVSRCLRLFITDLDVVCNLARTLSVLSSDEAACTALTEDEDFAGTAVRVLEKYPGRRDIVVRLTYTLGNLMAKCDQVRPTTLA